MLDDNGVGNLADVIAGIDWVIQHAKLLNIRVMNLSLAAELDRVVPAPIRWRVPRAAAVASGVVVVVAAGNFGKLPTAARSTARSARRATTRR